LQSERNKTRATKENERARWDRVAALVISTVRRDLDVTQQELADLIGWTRDAVANAERGRRHLRISDLIMIARALRMEPEALTRKIVRWQS
jgi:transcriptional regulator with XRE-family HTH domain